jgi:hypothetical protein
MAAQTMTLDPLAQSYTGDQMITAINGASTAITRANSVSATARPIASLEVDATKIAAGAIKTKLTSEADGSKLTTTELAAAAAIASGQVAAGVAKANLDAMAATAVGYIKTAPTTGQFTVTTIQRDSAGKLNVGYDDVAH